MRESDVQRLFSKKNEVLGAFELKIVKGKSLPFSAVKEHQVRALRQVEEEGFSWKISDFSLEQKPFDCFRIHERAYVVPVWYLPRVRKTAYYIRIHDFCDLRDAAGRKSMTEEMAESVAEWKIDL